MASLLNDTRHLTLIAAWTTLMMVWYDGRAKDVRPKVAAYESE